MLRRELFLQGMKLLDLLVPAAALAVSITALSGSVSLHEFLSVHLTLSGVILLAGCLASWHVVFSCFHLYDPGRFFRVHHETAAIVKAASVATAVLLAAALMFRIHPVTPVFTGSFWTAAIVAGMATRALLRLALKRFRIGQPFRKDVIVVGSNSRAVGFVREIESSPESGYILKGFADDILASPEIGGARYPLVSCLKNLPEFLRKNVVDEVVIALPARSCHVQAAAVAAACREQGIAVRFLSDLFNARNPYPLAGRVGALPVISSSAGGESYLPLAIKRLVDVFLASILLLCFLPLFLGAAVAVKATSRGPAFFAQKRLGINKRLFRLYKFRTMVEDAENRIHEIEHLNEAEGPAFKIRNDPRITSIGRFLRKTSIDELPQLFNVLRGDMSLVGPRPMSVRDYERFEKDWHRRRFSVRPGMTCLWQCGGRSNVSFEEWMRLDLKYIENWSLLLDVKILVQTIPAVLKGSGAA